MTKTFAISSDHAGFNLKQSIIENLQKNYQIFDYGCFNDQEKVDYPDYVQKICNDQIKGKFNFTILICSSGIGMSIAANRFDEIRAALCFNKKMALSSRRHNDANILVLGADYLHIEQAIEMIEIFLSTEFSNEQRHIKRLNKIKELKLNV